jgi:hypothetical protein
MKTILTLTAALIGGVALPAMTFAGTTESTTGCATKAVDGATYTVRVDPTCALSVDPSGNAVLVNLGGAILADLLTPDEEEPAAE